MEQVYKYHPFQSNLSLNKYAFFILILLLLPFSIFGFKLANGIVYLFLFILLFLNFKYKASLIFLSATIFLIFSYQTILFNIENILHYKDIIELLKFPLFLILFGIGYRCRINYSIKNWNKLMFKIFSIQVIFSLLVFFDIFHPIVDIYKGRNSDNINHFEFLRFSGFFGYPSIFGIYCMFFLLLIYFVNGFKNNKLQFLLLIFGFILSFSKTGFILFPFIFITLSIFFNYKISLLISITSLLSFTMLLFFHFDLLNWIVTKAQTANYRLNEIFKLVSLFKDGNIFGFGPNNINLLKPVESALFYYGYKFGITGVIYYILIVLFTIYNFFRISNKDSKVFFCFTFFVLIGGVMGDSIIDEFKSVAFFPVMYGYYCNKNLI